MSALADHQIRDLALAGMIEPFAPQQVKTVHVPLFDGPGGTVDQSYDKRIVSYGVTSYGYDARLASSFKVFTPVHPGGSTAIMDPKDPDVNAFVDIEAGECLVIPPHGYVLGHTIETFDIPTDCIVICLGKSTYARTGLMVNVTPLEPGWKGQVTLEFFNALPIPTKVYPNEGICQFIFFRGDAQCETSYKDRAGKYMDQKGVVIAKT